jgi:hypothetical protein
LHGTTQPPAAAIVEANNALVFSTLGYCLVPAVFLGGLLWSKQPPIIFQQLMGVNLTAGSYESEVNQGKWLLAESTKLGRSLNLYSPGKYGEGVVEMVDWVKSIA